MYGIPHLRGGRIVLLALLFAAQAVRADQLSVSWTNAKGYDFAPQIGMPIFVVYDLTPAEFNQNGGSLLAAFFEPVVGSSGTTNISIPHGVVAEISINGSRDLVCRPVDGMAFTSPDGNETQGQLGNFVISTSHPQASAFSFIIGITDDATALFSGLAVLVLGMIGFGVYIRSVKGVGR